MALLFPRLARNFVKNGYYPTDSVTLDRIVDSLKFTGRNTRILDPCCGEGSALSAIHQSLSANHDQVESYGVEYDRERAWHSKQLLDHCIHGDIQDCMISARSFGLLYLNPPYSDTVSDCSHRTRDVYARAIRRTMAVMTTVAAVDSRKCFTVRRMDFYNSVA